MPRDSRPLQQARRQLPRTSAIGLRIVVVSPLLETQPKTRFEIVTNGSRLPLSRSLSTHRALRLRPLARA